MIVNLESKTINRISEFKYEIIFDLPKLYFDPTQTVYANEVAIHWKSKTNSTALLQTTLIDKSPLNTSQQLLFIFQRKICRTIMKLHQQANFVTNSCSFGTSITLP